MTDVRQRWREKVAREHGWFCKWDERRGCLECAADDPDARPDHNRAEGFIQTGTDVGPCGGRDVTVEIREAFRRARERGGQ